MNKNNRGSAVVEVTLMVPVIFGSLYFFVMSMLFIVEHGKLADELSEKLYESSKEEACEVKKQGNTEFIKYNEVFNDYEIYFDFSKNGDDVVKNLRRWQLIADTIH